MKLSGWTQIQMPVCGLVHAWHEKIGFYAVKVVMLNIYWGKL